MNIVKFDIRNEIKEWFEELIHETCGPDAQISYSLDDGHFTSHTNVEIRSSEHKINLLIELIGNTSELTTYKLPWLNGNTFYVRSNRKMKSIEEKVNAIPNANYKFAFQCSPPSNIFGFHCRRVHFQTDLDDTLKLEIEKIFRESAYEDPIFITYPRTTIISNQFTCLMTTNILTAFHGKFLNYLNTSDIFALESANGTNAACYDKQLDQDIQKFLRENCPRLYDGTKADLGNLKSFTVNEVLRHFIHKYHKCFNKIEISSNILTGDEIRSLSRSYNIEILHLNIIHLDFKSLDQFESFDFCIMYHFDPKGSTFINYHPKYATENYLININDDNSIDPLKCSYDFTNFVLKSQINCSPQKSNSVLKSIAEHFRPLRNHSKLLLYEVDLNHVSTEILGSLLTMMRQGQIHFDTMNFSFKTIITILEQANQNHIEFRKCRIDVGNNGIMVDSLIRILCLRDMDVDLQLFGLLRRIECLRTFNCRILRPIHAIPIHLEIADRIYFEHTNFDTATLLSLLYALQHSSTTVFLSCELTPCDLIDMRPFKFLNVVQFTTMIFTSQTLSPIFENCEFQEIIFKSCRFYFENDGSYKFSLKPVKVNFSYGELESFTLIRILQTMNRKTYVCIKNCYILPLDRGAEISNKRIRIEHVQFLNCKLELHTVFKILSKAVKMTKVIIKSCYLLPSDLVDLDILTLTKVKEITFRDMKLTSSDLFAILAIFEENSFVTFTNCEITVEGDGLHKINLQRIINIQFFDMKIEWSIAQAILQSRSLVHFCNCDVTSITDEFSHLTIQSHVVFGNMLIDLSTHLKALANFSPESILQFRFCQFEITKPFLIRNTVIKPHSVIFQSIILDSEVLVTILERISENTSVMIDRCELELKSPVFSIRPIKASIISFSNMKVDMEIILRVLQNVTSQSRLRFNNCSILYSKSYEMSNLKLKPHAMVFFDMDIDVGIFKFFMQNCPAGVVVQFEECIFELSNKLSNVTLDISRLIFENTRYSAEHLLILEQLNVECIVEYHEPQPYSAIIDICTKTPVYGNRLLLSQPCTKQFCFELFGEFFRCNAFNAALDPAAVYDVPTYLIPKFSSMSYDDQYDWNAFKIIFVPVNDWTVKLDYLKNNKLIDLFYELNDLPDDD